MLETLIAAFETIEDPRCEGKVGHRLLDILVSAVCAVLGEAESFEDIALYGRCKRQWLEGFLALPNGIPSHDTFRRGLMLVDPDAFERSFLDWVRAVFRPEDGAPRQVAIDGKTPDSIGRRNTSLTGSQPAVESLGRRSPTERLARSAVEGGGHGRELVGAMHAQVGALREVLSQQPVGVLVRPPLPRGARIAKVHLQARVDPQPRVLRHLRPLVPGQRPSERPRQGGDGAPDRVAYRLGPVPGQCRPVL